jgi:hypothetical protein
MELGGGLIKFPFHTTWFLDQDSLLAESLFYRHVNHFAPSGRR